MSLPRALLVALLALLPAPAASAAQTTTTAPLSIQAPTALSSPGAPSGLTAPRSLDSRPPGRRMTPREAMAIADRIPKIRAERRKHPGSTRSAFLKGADRWQISYYARPRFQALPPREIGQAQIFDPSGGVIEAWTGFQVPWMMARGYPGAFGRKANAPYIWIGLCLLFVLPFLRPPLRLLHLDLAALLAFSVSYAYFQDAQIDTSVPLAYPLLAYLLARMLGIAWARGRPDRAPPKVPLRLLTPDGFLGIAIVFLVGFRVGLNITDSNVIDVGYAGVVGADRLTHGQQLWGEFPSDISRGDTYGPLLYMAYVPFELLWPWGGVGWTGLGAAHAAAIAFDLLSAGGLWLLGRRLGGQRLGLLLAYLWMTFPFTLLVANSCANDSLVALLVIASVLAIGSAGGRGALVAAAALTKFAPLGLAPLLATYRGPTRPGANGAARRGGWLKPAATFSAVLAATTAVLLLPAMRNGGLSIFYERTLEFQGERGSPFSIWGLYDGLGTWQDLTRYAAIALAVAVAFVPRRRDVYSVAALGAAVLIALQLTVTHWFYLYLVWFLPLALVAMLSRHVAPPSAEPDPKLQALRPHSGARAPAVGSPT